MNEEAIRRIIADSRFADRLFPLIDYAVPALRLTRFTASLEDLRPGASRIGGLPDLSPEDDWPIRNGQPLDFLAQIDLAEVAVAAGLPDMPPAGSLCFFYDETDQPWGYDPKDRDGWRVIYSDAPTTSLRRMEPPAPATTASSSQPGFLARLMGRQSAIPEPSASMEPFLLHAVRFEAELTLPNAYEFFADDTEDDDELWEELETLWEKLEPDGNGPYHRMGGHPSQIQGDMKLECQLVSGGVGFGEGDASDGSRGHALTAGADDWQLLLQLDSDKYPGWMWGDCGRLYFWIRRQDLQARRFDRTWCVLQCY